MGESFESIPTGWKTRTIALSSGHSLRHGFPDWDFGRRNITLQSLSFVERRGTL